ncbi:MAG: pilus assembly protein [Devosia sp.]|nr:pilus assembly protein [Devosia sp.]
MTKRRSWLRWMLAPALRGAYRFRRDDRGVTAVEFGILALPFFTLIAAILETSLIFFASQILDSSVQDASRVIRTGQLQTGASANNTLAAFRTRICNNLYNMMTCANVKVKVSVVANFGSATVTYPIQTGNDCTTTNGVKTCNWTITESYAPGAGGDVVLIQAYYKWPTIVRLPGFNLQDQVDGTRLLGAVRVFRNEPFGCSNCT